MTDPRPAFVKLCAIGDAATARILAARLEAEGIGTRLHGEAMGPYPLTVGQMAVTEIWVEDGKLDWAQEVMLEAEVADAVGGAETELPDWRFTARLLALVFAAWLAWMVLRGFLRAL